MRARKLSKFIRYPCGMQNYVHKRTAHAQMCDLMISMLTRHTCLLFNIVIDCDWHQCRRNIGRAAENDGEARPCKHV